MTDEAKDASRIKFGLGVFLLCLGIMLFELSLTRVLSVLYYYHTAFLAISVAMLGLGAGGLVAFLFPSLIDRHRLKVLLGSALSMGLLPFLFPVIELGSGDMEEFFGAQFLLSITITIVTIVVPFIAGGALLAKIFRDRQGDVARLYAFDMIGAALGALLLVPTMEFLGGAGALYLSGAIVASSAIFLLGARIWGVAVLVLLAATAAVVGQNDLLAIRVDVDNRDSSTRVLTTKWNAFSRVVAVEHEGFDRGLSATRMEFYGEAVPEQIDALIDINAYAPMLEFDGDLTKVTHLADVVSNLGYWIRKPNFDAAIIGPGGGKDVLGCLLFEPKSITAIEINPILVDDFVRGEFKSFTGDIYGHEKVDVIVGDGRSVLTRLDRKYDIIVANSVATWAAHSSGAMNLTESGLFTTEAFVEYRDKLKDDGLLSVSLWDEADHSLPLRLIETWQAANNLGEEIGNCVVVIGNRWGDERWFTNVLMSKKPFTEDQLLALGGASDELDFDRIWWAHEGEDELEQYFKNPSLFKEECRYDIEAATDNRPFFFYTIRFSEATRFWDQQARTDNAAWFSLIASFVVLTIFVVGLIGLPLWWIRKNKATTSGLSGRENLFFCLLGASFMLVEISLIQRLTLFLGHPTYALTVVLSGLLAWSGIGSFWADRLTKSESKTNALRKVLLALSLIALPMWFLIPDAGDAFTQQTTFIRILVSLLILCPLGILMGMPMPLALFALGDRDAGSIPWAWGLNGAIGVLASVAAVIIAITCGFTLAFCLGGSFYLLAAFVWPSGRESR